ncbi:MAG TPA: hypothetical protein VIB79_28985, partial [Candidatus Binatia bacterium]
RRDRPCGRAGFDTRVRSVGLVFVTAAVFHMPSCFFVFGPIRLATIRLSNANAETLQRKIRGFAGMI